MSLIWPRIRSEAEEEHIMEELIELASTFGHLAPTFGHPVMVIFFVNKGSCHMSFGQIIAASHDLTPKCSWGREIPFWCNILGRGWGNISRTFRLVKYYSLARCHGWWWWWSHFCCRFLNHSKYSLDHHCRHHSKPLDDETSTSMEHQHIYIYI